MYDHLRSSPVYQNALRAPSARNLHPVNYLNCLKKRHWPDVRIQQTGIRLDHLFRNALDPSYSSISREHVSAIITFLECLDRDLPHWSISRQTRAAIEPRIVLARQIVEQRRADCAAHGLEPPSSVEFRELITRHGAEIVVPNKIEAVVYDNPIFHYVQMALFVPKLYWRLYPYWD